MDNKPAKNADKLSNRETEQRRDAALLRALKTPPKPHENMKIGKGQKKPKPKRQGTD